VENGCELCSIIWYGFEEQEKSIGARRNDEEIAEFYKGEIFFGTDRWWEGSKPKIIITLYCSRTEEFFKEVQLCSLDVFAKRSEWS
jgi:hypothetical protein